MARINIEEEAWKRIYRLADLVGCDVREAAGTVACLWNFSQDLVKTHGTREEILDWSNLFKNSDEKIDRWLKSLEKARFIFLEESGLFLIRGNESQLKNMASKISRASKGGKALKKKLRELKVLQAVPKHSSSGPEAGSKGLNAMQFNAVQSNSNQGSAGQGIQLAIVEKKPDKNAAAFIAAYCSRFKSRWGFNPKILGKDQGTAKRLAKDLTQDQVEVLLDAYFQMPDSGVIKAKHPLNFFEMKLNEISVFANSGDFTTRTQAIQQDGSVSNALMLQRVREGKL